MTAAMLHTRLPGSERALRLMLADDTSDLRRLLRIVVERTRRYTVVAEARDGAEAIVVAETQQPDVILLDLAMPVLDGLSALPELRRVAPEAQIIVLSGFDDPHLTEEAMRRGAHGYIVKSGKIDELLARIDYFASRAADPGTEATPTPHATSPDIAEPNIDDLIDVLTHDLAEPARTVNAFVELLSDHLDGHNDEMTTLYLDALKRAADRIDTLTSDLRAFSMPANTLRWVNVELGPLTEDVLMGLGGMLADSNARVDIGDLPPVRGDARLLGRLVQNLLTNAVKFTAPGVVAHVTMSATREGDWWRVVVRDNGIGVADADRERIFEPLTRLHSHDDYEGSGLGLAICRKVVSLHGGDIGVEPVPAGGSDFWFTLPAVG